MILRFLRCARLVAFALCQACIFVACSTVRCLDCVEDKLPSSTDFPALKTLRRNTNSTDSWRHIYLEGDGIPWKRGVTPNSNPNSRQKLALQLMMQDPQDSIYINRPCYGYHGEPPAPCEPRWWTSARYHTLIVTALNNAIDEIQKSHREKPLVLIGHSGGGSLAMLIAQLRDDVAGVVTIAGNLDPDAWTDFHRYEALSESENPSLTPPLDADIFRWHFVGKDDHNLPPALTSQALANDSHAELFITDNKHNCCWVKQWPEILKRLDQYQQRDEE